MRQFLRSFKINNANFKMVEVKNKFLVAGNSLGQIFLNDWRITVLWDFCYNVTSEESFNFLNKGGHDTSKLVDAAIKIFETSKSIAYYVDRFNQLPPIGMNFFSDNSEKVTIDEISVNGEKKLIIFDVVFTETRE